MSKNIISVSNLSKEYRVYSKESSKLINLIFPSYTKDLRVIKALNNISFNVSAGDAVGIIGKNGSGKSTLLQILSGTIKQSAGDYKIDRNLFSLLELGTGFNYEYSAYDNVVLNGLFYGKRKKDITSKISHIFEFAELLGYEKYPLKTFSSGMIIRLAFSIQLIIEPNVIIIDEALSVGDIFFQQKSYDYIRKLVDNGASLMFVSHDMGLVKKLCNKALYLKHGDLVDFGETDTVIQQYLNADDIKEYNNTGLNLCGEIYNVSIKNNNNNNGYRINDDITITVLINSIPNEENVISMNIKDVTGSILTSINTLDLTDELLNSKKTNQLKLTIDLKLSLEAGLYTFDFFLGVKKGKNDAISITKKTFGPINIEWNYDLQTAPFLGKFGLPIKKKLNYANISDEN
ncbi:MAG: ATP-binding cassette domain-containing protein [Pseudomonadota bacterium]|nr:ATP-binding cassette domain-containing protein [Pseudomonadota bacterium]